MKETTLNSSRHIVINDDDLRQVDWQRDPETGAYNSDGARIEHVPGDDFAAWVVGDSIALSRNGYGQTINIPLGLVPTILEVLHDIYEDQRR